MLKETTINDKNNNKIIAKLHQVYFKVKMYQIDNLVIVITHVCPNILY